MTTLGATLKAARARLGLSLVGMAERANCFPSQLSDYESGLRQPHAKTLRRLAEGYEISIEELLGLASSNGEPAQDIPAGRESDGRTDDNPAQGSPGERPASLNDSNSAASAVPAAATPTPGT